MKTIIALVISLGVMIILFGCTRKPKKGEMAMPYHVMNLDTEEVEDFATKAECVGRVAWPADPPYEPSGYKIYKDGSAGERFAFRDNDGFSVAACDGCIREPKPNIDAVQAWLMVHLP